MPSVFFDGMVHTLEKTMHFILRRKLLIPVAVFLCACTISALLVFTTHHIFAACEVLSLGKNSLYEEKSHWP